MELTARKTLSDLSVTTIRSIRQPVASLSGGQRQSVAVAKAVMSQAKLVILDEPTAALGVAQTRMVLSLIKRLTSQGVAVLVVSHNLNDVFAVADRIVVLYLGRMVAQGPASEFDPTMVVDYMTTGRSSRGPADAAASRQEAVMADETSHTEVPSELEEPPLSIEQEEDATAAPESAIETTAAAPEVLADSLGEYLQAWGRRIRNGESGALPIVVGLIVIIIFFQIERSRFDSAINLVNLLQQSAIYIMLGAAEIFALILSEIDLSVGFMLAFGGWVMAELIAPPVNFPWWLGILGGLAACGGDGLHPGEPDHEAAHPVVRRHARRPAVPGGGGDPARIGGPDRGRRRDLGLEHQPDLQAGEQQHQPGRLVDRAGGGARDIRGLDPFSRGAPARAGAQYAAAQHHVAHDRASPRSAGSWSSTSATSTVVF